jgi:hypothetical protein
MNGAMTKDSNQNNELLDYAWKHFSAIAEQRIKTFNFYVILLAASIGATLTIFEKLKEPDLLIVCGSANIVIALIFFLIDQRGRRLIQIPKDALIEIETSKGWNFFTRDVKETALPLNRFVSFTVAFRIAFLAQTAFGVWVLVRACALTHRLC